MKCWDGTKQPNAEVGALSLLFPNMNPKVVVVMVVSVVVEEVRMSYLLLICLYSRYVRMFSVLGLHHVTAKLFSEKRGGAPNRGLDPPMSNIGASPASTLEVHPPVHSNQKHQKRPSECGMNVARQRPPYKIDQTSEGQ
jgi:hypothetical protein